jgi:hypothetical protein
VDAGGQLIEWIHRFVLEPVVEIPGILRAADHDDILRPGNSHRVEQLLHPGRLIFEPFAGTSGASVEDTLPRVGRVGVVIRIWLVKQIEDDGGVAFECIGDRSPERGRIALVGHWDLAPGFARPALRREVHIDDYVHTRNIQRVHVLLDRLLVCLP